MRFHMHPGRFITPIQRWILLFSFVACIPFAGIKADDGDSSEAAELDELERAVFSMIPDPQHPHDPFILVTLEEAIKAKREKAGGGVGACLVRESTGEIVERGRNHQFAPYFRSDMHAEMDLLNRYEDHVRISRPADNKAYNPRRTDGLVLYSSVEPCPMCLARIIDAGLKKTYYAAPDPTGGMVHKIKDMPPFWTNAAKGRIYAEADCSPAMKDIAACLFGHGQRKIKY
jgi:tRNA(adenine34) deaminase